MSKPTFKATSIIRAVLKQYDVPSRDIWTNKYSDESKRTVKFYARVKHNDNAKIINEVKRKLKKHGETLVDVRFTDSETHGARYTSYGSPSSIIFEVNV